MATYIYFHYIMENPEISAKVEGHFPKMGGSLVADGRNKNGTVSMRETVFTEMINNAEELE